MNKREAIPPRAITAVRTKLRDAERALERLIIRARFDQDSDPLLASHMAFRTLARLLREVKEMNEVENG